MCFYEVLTIFFFLNLFVQKRNSCLTCSTTRWLSQHELTSTESSSATLWSITDQADGDVGWWKPAWDPCLCRIHQRRSCSTHCPPMGSTFTWAWRSAPTWFPNISRWSTGAKMGWSGDTTWLKIVTMWELCKINIAPPEWHWAPAKAWWVQVCFTSKIFKKGLSKCQIIFGFKESGEKVHFHVIVSTQKLQKHLKPKTAPHHCKQHMKVMFQISQQQLNIAHY